MLITLIAVACGGALGAVARFGTNTFTQLLLGARFPIGTLLANCLGAFFIGFLMNFLMERYAGNAEIWRLFLVVGFLGAYTTFSSFAWETTILYENGELLGAVLNIVLNNLGTLIMVLLGIKSARLLGGIA